VSALNEFVYCPRRYYYQRYYDEIGEPYELVDGRSKHEHASRRGNWVTERYFRSDDLGMHGKIDLIDTEDGTPTPVERKRSESGSYYPSDEVQLAGYCMLLEEALGEPVNVGYIYLYSTDTRHSVRITQDHRETVQEILRRIRAMSVDSIPSRRKLRGHLGSSEHALDVPEGDFWCGYCGYGPTSWRGINAHHGSSDHDGDPVRLDEADGAVDGE